MSTAVLNEETLIRRFLLYDSEQNVNQMSQDKQKRMLKLLLTWIGEKKYEENSH